MARPHAPLLLFALALLACDPAPTLPAGGDPDGDLVVASSYPMAYVCERLLGSAEGLHLLAVEGDPATWHPSREQVARMQRAHLLVFNGAGHERWASKVSLPQERIVRSAEAFRDRWLERQTTPNHSHGETGAQSHGGVASTTWLDLDLLRAQVGAIAERMIAAELAPAAALRERAAALDAELAEIDKRLREAGEGKPQPALLASHPVYGYLARRYRLRVRSLAWEPEQDPGPEGWRALDALLESGSARWMLWEREPQPATRMKLRERGLKVLVVAPCAHRPEEGDLLSVMRANAERLAAVYGQ